MKRIISIMAVTAILFLVLGACREKIETKTETTTTSSSSTTTEKTTEATTEITTELTKTTTEIIIETEPVGEEIITEYETEQSDTKTIVFNKGKYKFEFEKTNFEDNISKEVLDEISKFIPMEFGCSDYENWDGTIDEIINDTFYGCECRFLIDTYDYESDDWNEAIAEIDEDPIPDKYYECFFTTVEDINRFLRDYYGPNAREFETDDFITYEDFKSGKDTIFDNYNFKFKIAYLPKSETIVLFYGETFGGETEQRCLRDVRTTDGKYIAEVIFDTYYPFVEKHYITIASESNGNLYVESVDKKYVLHEDLEDNYKVISNDDVNIEMQKYESGEWKVVDTISKNEEVYAIAYYDDENYLCVVTEDYIGRVEKKYLTEIE